MEKLKPKKIIRDARCCEDKKEYKNYLCKDCYYKYIRLRLIHNNAIMDTENEEEAIND